MLYVSLCIVSGGAFRALCVGDFRLLLAFLLEWLQLGHCCWMLSPTSRGHAPPRFGVLQWSLRELPRWLGCLRRTSVALLFVRDEGCEAWRGGRNTSDCKSHSVLVSAVGQSNRKTGNTLPCEGGSFTDFSALVCSSSLGSHFLVHNGNSSCVVVSRMACCFGLRFARAWYRAVREADAKSWLLDWNGRVALEVDRILCW